MDYSGPDPADFADVAALNRAFLLRLRSPAQGGDLRDRLPRLLQSAVTDLTDSEVERLSAAPFLLCSLRESDLDYWDRVLADDRIADLFAPDAGAYDELAVAALSFLWQLARRNPYAARLVSGASPGWCDRIGERTLVKLLRCVAGRRDVLRPRLARIDTWWGKLLGPGLSPDRDLRLSAQLACLQKLLTRAREPAMPPLRTAACRHSAPVLSVSSRQRPG